MEDDDASEDETHPVVEVLDRFFAEQEPESWSLRRPWDLQAQDSKTEAKKTKVDIFSIDQVTLEGWVQIASFLDPHDIDSLAVSCKASHAALKYPTNTNTIAGDALPALGVRLESIFRYFRILKLYADQVQKLGYTWVDIVKLFTQIAHAMQRRYCQTFEVHPIHRALVAEGILERLCNGCGNNAEELPILVGYGSRANGDIRQHFRTTAIKQGLNRVPTRGSNVERHNTIYGDDWVVSMGDASQLRNAPDQDHFIPNWLDNASKHHSTRYSHLERTAIAEKRCPVVWLFDYPGDSNGFEVGITVSDNNWQTQFHNWSPYYGVNVCAPRFWGQGMYGGGIELQGVAHYLLLFPGVSMEGETLGPGQRLLRLAWLYAHQLYPMVDHNNPHNIFEDWEAAIVSIQEDDDEDQGPGGLMDVVHANVRSLMVDKTVVLAQAEDYRLEMDA